MAGRQRSAARKVAAIEQRADELFADFYALMPELYRDRILANHPLSMQPLCAAWADAWTGMTKAHKGLVALREMLEDRAAALPDPMACPFIESTVGEGQAVERAPS